MGGWRAAAIESRMWALAEGLHQARALPPTPARFASVRVDVAVGEWAMDVGRRREERGSEGLVAVAPGCMYPGVLTG